VTEVNGIGSKYETKLAESKITTLDQLAKLDAAVIAEVLEVSEVRAMSFIDEAKQLLK
jgi:predicted flap endonuclease-1-like 5' DNA nuclease